jgi:hypothetical protein
MNYQVLAHLNTYDLEILGTYRPDSFVVFPLYGVGARRITATALAEGGR